MLAYKKHIERVVNDAISEFPRTMALRVDVHYPPILDRGDTVCCFPNLEPGAISRFRNALNAMLEANERTRAANGKRIYPNRVRHVWAREFSEEGKCHFHLGLFFNKDAYYHLGDYEAESNLRMMIIRAWYSALGLELDAQELAPEMLAKKALATDIVIAVISARTSEELMTMKGKETVKNEIMEKINERLKDGRVKNVYFTNFIVQ